MSMAGNLLHSEAGELAGGQENCSTENGVPGLRLQNFAQSCCRDPPAAILWRTLKLNRW